MMIEQPYLPHAHNYSSDFFVKLSWRFRVHFCDILRSRYNFIGMKCQSLPSKDDGYYMRRCVELAKKAIGHTNPNPMVGCVIVKDGEIVGEGFHPKAGQPHAEVFALRDARGMAKNGIAYVSLEPCNHYGRTPPCTDALINAGVRKVVVGMVDPNPLVASMGLCRLRASGIEVVTGIENELCRKLNETYIHFMLEKMPFVTLRYSASVNGELLGTLGDRSTERGGYYSELLKENDAVILISRSPPPSKMAIPASQEAGAKQPFVILTNQASPVEIENPSRVMVFTDAAADLEMMLRLCYSRGICSVLVDVREHSEYAVRIIEAGVKKKSIQKVVTEILPVWGSGSGHDAEFIHPSGVSCMRRIRNLHSRSSGESVLVEGYLCDN